MVKFKEASARMFRNVYICKKCKTKIRTTPQKVMFGLAKCRRCGHKALRSVRKAKAKAQA